MVIEAAADNVAGHDKITNDFKIIGLNFNKRVISYGY